MQEHLPEPVELDGEWGLFLERFEDATAHVRRALAEKYPEEFRFLAKGKRNLKKMSTPMSTPTSRQKH